MPHVIEMSLSSMHRTCLHLHSTILSNHQSTAANTHQFCFRVMWAQGKVRTTKNLKTSYTSMELNCIPLIFLAICYMFVLILPNRLKPSLTKPSPTLQESLAN